MKREPDLKEIDAKVMKPSVLFDTAQQEKPTDIRVSNAPVLTSNLKNLLNEDEGKNQQKDKADLYSSMYVQPKSKKPGLFDDSDEDNAASGKQRMGASQRV